MPRKPCYWTRKLELELVEFVRQREFIWKPFNNTNHQIQQKYKAYAEFAAKLGRGYSARSVRDRWVNIRSTFNHNLRRVDKSKETATSPAEVYVPCWPLWKPLQFLREVPKREDVNFENYPSMQPELSSLDNIEMKEESQSDMEEIKLGIRQRGKRTDRPRRQFKTPTMRIKKNKCVSFIDNLLIAMKPISEPSDMQYWFFGRHVTERLNSMRDIDASSASKEIIAYLNQCRSLNDSDIKSEGTLE
ncbi:PREDICTED: uncharacterized protein LOC106105545 [Papilio polytes]|uniref:uncharacterized protein LOC106105545 n=1 Tax=Papilio polytes TaxID=76194 RepID=UPI000676144E|nr:PREDICTED: uncharacterized protein LOC106105545 [Papilio polytes]